MHVGREMTRWAVETLPGREPARRRGSVRGHAKTAGAGWEGPWTAGEATLRWEASPIRTRATRAEGRVATRRELSLLWEVWRPLLLALLVLRGVLTRLTLLYLLRKQS